MERKKIWKRCTVVFSILLLIGVVSYTMFNCVTTFADSSIKREIAYEIQKIREKGEPATIEELIPEGISDEENGALILGEAFKIREDLAKKYKEEEKYFPLEGTVPWDKVSEEDKKKVVNLIIHNPEYIKIYQLFEKASTMECQFLKKEDYEKGMEILLPHLAQLRSCARLLAAKAKLQAEEGKIEEALNTCLIGLRMSKSLSEEFIMVSQLVRIALDSIILTELEDVLKKGEGSIEICQTLIREIEEERSDMMIYSSLHAERIIFGMTYFAVVREYAEESLKNMEEEKGKKLSNEEIIEKFYKIKILGEPVIGKKDRESKEYKEFIERMRRTYGNSENILEDFFDNQNFYYLRTMARAISLVKKPYWEARQETPAFNKEIENLPKEKAILTQMLLPALTRCHTMEARTDALLGDAEIALACFIYKAKYGEFPSILEKFVPEIFPSLPLDPFTGKNYIYKRVGDGFLVYSLGDNCKDDGGKWGKPNRWKGDFDIVFEMVK